MYLKDIGAYDFQETTLVSILVDFLPDEVSREVNIKVGTVRKKLCYIEEPANHD